MTELPVWPSQGVGDRGLLIGEAVVRRLLRDVDVQVFNLAKLCFASDLRSARLAAPPGGTPFPRYHSGQGSSRS